jgi:poly(A) polymerase/tRNA nucleotidyltransferase (CCA-adding enzyme)
MDRSNDLILPAETPWLRDENAQNLCAIFADAGHLIYFVGGCVRNAVLGEAASDIDLSTNVHPETVMALAKATGLKAIPTGIEHGTVTVVIDGTPFEITTFRRDIETDGRRAVVAFSDDIVDDARRRDFTMNALYADANGRVVDPLNGLTDARARRVRFIEDAAMRIREDYLRSLRFFRFSAWYGDAELGFDPDALDAIASNLDGLKTLSAERVGSEMVKLLTAPNPSASLAIMRQTGVLQTVLVGADDTWLGPLVHVEQVLGLAPDAMRRLAALGGMDVETTLRLSKSQARHFAILRDGLGSLQNESELGYRYGIDAALSIVALRAAFAGQIPRTDAREKIEQGAQAKFPVTAADLQPAFQGPALGKQLKALEQDWIASGFAKTKAQLLG